MAEGQGHECLALEASAGKGQKVCLFDGCLNLWGGVGLDAVGLYQPQIPGQEEELQELRDGCSGSVHSKSQFTTQAPTAPARPQSQTHALPSFLLNFKKLYIYWECACVDTSVPLSPCGGQRKTFGSQPLLSPCFPRDQTQVFRLGNKYLYLPSLFSNHLLFAFMYLFVLCLSVCLSLPCFKDLL